MKQNKKGQFFNLLFVAVCIIIIIFIVIKESVKECKYIEDETKIYSLNMANNLQGSFFLGIGNFGNSVYYYFYKEEGNGIILDKLNAEYVILIETNDRYPSYVEYSCNCVLKNCEGNNKRTLYIPIGTVKTNYNINTNDI